MNKKLIITIALFILILAGCTAPTQPMADRDLQVAQTQYATITHDLSQKAKYNALKNADKTIAESDQPAERQKALLEMSDEYIDIGHLDVQAERAAGLLRNGREWVKSQRGILDVLYEDWTKAKANSDAKATSKPS